MLCDDCNMRDATMHMTKIINGKKRETYLCEECGRKNKNMTLQNSFSIHGFLSDLLEGSNIVNANNSLIEEKKCTQCGHTYKNFKETGRLGCGTCYDTFEGILSPLIRRVQGHSLHVGKVPEKHGGIIKIKKQIKDLKDDLKDLIVKEEFEKAAKVRDHIKEMEDTANKLQEG